MNATETVAQPTNERPGYSPYKLGFGIGTVLVLASIFLFLSFFTLWIDRQLLDSQQWTKTSTEALERPAVRNALANYLVDQLFANVDVESELKAQLPNDWDVLASPATSALRSLTLNGTKQVLDLPVVQQVWMDANELSHEQLITILEGGNDKVSTTGGVVTINAQAILKDVANKVGLSGNLVDKLPASAGSIEIYRSQDLATAQSIYKIAKDLRYVFAGLALLLFVLAIGLASGRRRRAVIWMGVSIVTVGLLVLITQSLARGAVVDSLAQTNAVVPAVSDIYEISTELLRAMAISLTFTGVCVLLATLVTGPYEWAISVRHFFAPYLRDYLALSAAAAALLFLILVWISPVSGFRTTVGLVINTLLAIAGFIALVSITRKEFPDAEQADFGAAGAWIGRQWKSTRDWAEDLTKRESAIPSVKGGDAQTTVVSEVATDNVAELERLAELHKSGALTDEEFAAAKQKLISG